MPRIGRISKWFWPWLSPYRVGCCFRCETTWLFVNYHITIIDHVGTGVFPLCERCWQELQPLQRLSYYRQMYDEYLWKAEWDWIPIEQAVMSGG